MLYIHLYPIFINILYFIYSRIIIIYRATPVNRWNSWKRGNDVDSIIQQTFWNNSRHFFFGTPGVIGWRLWHFLVFHRQLAAKSEHKWRRSPPVISSAVWSTPLCWSKSQVLLINMVKTTIFHCSLLMKLVANSSSFMMTSSFFHSSIIVQLQNLVAELGSTPIFDPFFPWWTGPLRLAWPRLVQARRSWRCRRPARWATRQPPSRGSGGCRWADESTSPWPDGMTLKKTFL